MFVSRPHSESASLDQPKSSSTAPAAGVADPGPSTSNGLPHRPDPMALHRLVSLRVDNGGADSPSYQADVDTTLEAILATISSDPRSILWTDAERMTPLHRAAEAGAPVEVVSVLLDAADEALRAESEVRSKLREGGGPVSSSTTTPSFEFVATVAGTDKIQHLVEWRDLRGRMALHVACEYGRASPETIRLLVDRGPSAAGMVDKSSRTPLHHACSRPSAAGDAAAVVRLLVEACPDALLMRGSCGSVRSMAPLHLLARYGGPTHLVRLLAETRPEVTLWPDGEGQTPLMHAAERWAPTESLRALVEASGGTEEERREALGAMRDWRGRTPLHLACGSWGPYENALYLASQCPEAIEEKDRSGRTPLDYAAPELDALLKRYGRFCRSELDGPEQVRLFDECRRIECFEAVWWLVRKDPSIVHKAEVEVIFMAQLLAGVGQSCGMGVMWEILRGYPDLMAVNRISRIDEAAVR